MGRMPLHPTLEQYERYSQALQQITGGTLTSYRLQSYQDCDYQSVFGGIQFSPEIALLGDLTLPANERLLLKPTTEATRAELDAAQADFDLAERDEQAKRVRAEAAPQSQAEAVPPPPVVSAEVEANLRSAQSAYGAPGGYVVHGLVAQDNDRDRDLHVTREDGTTVIVRAGYQQAGKVSLVDEHTVRQDAGRGRSVTYPIAELEKALPEGELQRAAQEQRTLRVSVTGNGVEVSEVARERGKEPAAVR